MTPTHLLRLQFADTPQVVRGLITARTLELPGCRLVQVTFAPGARWSTDAAPFAGTTVCERAHDAVILIGTLGIQIGDGAAETVTAGDAIHLPPGHDAWTIGEQSCVFLEVEPRPDIWVQQSLSANQPAADSREDR